MDGAHFPAGYLGKIPGFGDFVRYSASGRETREFDQWVSEGLYFAQKQLGRDWDQLFLHAPVWRFAFCPDGASRFLVGEFRPSQDKNCRKYPFIITLLVDRPRFGRNEVYMSPVVFSDFLQKASAVACRAVEAVTMQEITDATRELDVPVSEFADAIGRYEMYAEQTSLSEFWKGMFSEPRDPRKFLLMNNLLEILSPFQRSKLSEPMIGLRFPLKDGIDEVGNQVCFWVHTIMSLLKRTAGMPTFFWSLPVSEGPRHLFVFFRQPSPRVFTQLVKSSLQSDTICFLEEEGADQAAVAKEKLPQSIRDVLDSPEASLRTLLNVL